MNKKIKIILLLATVIAIYALFIFMNRIEDIDTTNDQNLSNAPKIESIKLGILKSGEALGVKIMPTKITEDSRCPSDVTCIQAGSARVEAEIVRGKDAVSKIFTIGEPFYFADTIVTLVEVTPYPVSNVEITIEEYEFTFRVEKSGVAYVNTSSDEIQVDLPMPKGVVGKEFKIVGKARGGDWYFEGSFPVIIIDNSGKIIFESYASALDDWMTTDYVPFEGKVKIESNYIGEATLLLKKDNPSGLSEYDASCSFPITIEY